MKIILSMVVVDHGAVDHLFDELGVSPVRRPG